MFIELIDLLRCPREHEETWLVAAFNRMQGRFVIEGKLGCPVCNAEYTIEDGIPDLRTDPYYVALVEVPSKPVDPEEAVRLAAFLNLTREGATVLLTGDHSDSANDLADLAMTRTFAIRGHPWQRRNDSELVATVLADTRLPFAASSVDGIALGDHEKFSMNEISRVLKPGGRLVASSTKKLAGNIRELARDEDYVVAEAVGPLLNLRR